MTVAEIYSLARTLAYADSNNLPDSDAQKYLRLSYRSLVNSIKTQVNEDYFYDEWTTDTVANQREYALPKRTSSVSGCTKLLGVSVKYETGGDFVKCRETSLSALPDDLSSYSTQQPVSSPLYVISDQSVFVYPSPTSAVTGGLKLYGVADPYDPSTGDAESVLKIPLEFHEAIVHGMVYWYNVANGKNDLAQFSLQRFEAARREMVGALSDRTVSPNESVLPNLSNLG